MTSMTSTGKVAVPVAGSRIWTKCDVRLRIVAFGFLNEVAPGDGVGESVFEVELGFDKFVHGADDVGDDGIGGVEDAALDAELFVIGAEEVFVEVDDGVFAAGLVAEVA
jgi:hypothetical protein